MPFATALDVVSASELRDAIGSIGVLGNDISVTSSTDFVDCPGLAVQLDAFSIYEIDGYIAYSSGTTPDVKFAFSGPPDTSGNYTFFGLTASGTGGIGDIEAVRESSFVNDAPQPIAGVASGSLVCMPAGRIRTFRFGGALQVRFAQVTSNASATTVLTGSWLRAAKITDQF
jgi:hypothetical protein